MCIAQLSSEEGLKDLSTLPGHCNSLEKTDMQITRILVRMEGMLHLGKNSGAVEH